jgi:hypothetical protein
MAAGSDLLTGEEYLARQRGNEDGDKDEYDYDRKQADVSTVQRYPS